MIFCLIFSKQAINTFDLTKNYGRKKKFSGILLSKCTDEEFPIRITLTKSYI